MSSEDSEIIENWDILGSEAQRIIQLKDSPCSEVAMEFKLDLSIKGIEEGQSLLAFLKQNIKSTIDNLKFNSQQTSNSPSPNHFCVFEQNDSQKNQVIKFDD